MIILFVIYITAILLKMVLNTINQIYITAVKIYHYFITFHSEYFLNIKLLFLSYRAHDYKYNVV